MSLGRMSLSFPVKIGNDLKFLRDGGISKLQLAGRSTHLHFFRSTYFSARFMSDFKYGYRALLLIDRVRHFLK